MFSVEYEKTGSKEKPSYNVALEWVFNEGDGKKKSKASETLHLATIEKGQMETEIGLVSCWTATQASGATLRRKSLGAIKLELEKGLFEKLGGTVGASVERSEMERPASFDPEGE